MASQRRQNLFGMLGLSRLPWASRVYLVLVFTFAGLVFLSSLFGLAGPLGPVAVECLKTALAALLGALTQSARPGGAS